MSKKPLSAKDSLARQRAVLKKKSIPPAPRRKVVSKQTRTAPVRRKPVLPPEIGTRRGYSPNWLGRLKPLAFALSAGICLAVIICYLVSRGDPVSVSAKEAVAVSAPAQSETQVVEIVGGMTARQVCALLERQGVTSDGQGLLDYLVSRDLSSVLRSGSYLMRQGMTDEQIAAMLTERGDSVTVTVPFGYTIGSIDTYLANRGYAEAGEFVEATAGLQEAYGLSFVEGWLLGGSYSVSKVHGAEDLALAMYRSMLEALQPLLDSPKIAEYGVDAVLVIASMIQAETQNPQEMPLISSVIYNRLEAGEPLGIDATTRYELDDWENPIPVSALEEQTPYNTRRKVGLVPSGICSPSEAALEAACFPADTDYFFYLHGTDKRLHLAEDYEQHKRNISRYR